MKDLTAYKNDNYHILINCHICLRIFYNITVYSPHQGRCRPTAMLYFRINVTNLFNFRGLLPPFIFPLRLRVAASAFGRHSRPMADEGGGARQGGKVFTPSPWGACPDLSGKAGMGVEMNIKEAHTYLYEICYTNCEEIHSLRDRGYLVIKLQLVRHIYLRRVLNIFQEQALRRG